MAEINYMSIICPAREKEEKTCGEMFGKINECEKCDWNQIRTHISSYSSGIPLLTMSVVVEDGVCCGWINEEKGCIAQADTEEECKEKLLEAWWIKKHVEKTYIK